MMNHGVIRELTNGMSEGNHHREGSTPSTSNKSKSIEEHAKLTDSGSIVATLVKTALGVTVFLVISSVFSMVHTASQTGFSRDFDIMAGKIQDAFFYETYLKIFAMEDAAVTAADIARTSRRNFGATQETLETFQSKTADMQKFGRFHALAWKPLNKSPRFWSRRGSSTCESDLACQHGSILEHGIQILESGKSPVVSEAWNHSSTRDKIKSTIFYPIVHKQETVGAIIGDIQWDDFLSPTTFQKEHDGLVIVFENTLEQSWTYRVLGGKLKYIGQGHIYDEDFEDMVAISDYSTFVKPGGVYGRSASCSSKYRIRIYPSNELYEIYVSTWPKMFLLGSLLVVLTIGLLFLAYDIYMSRRYHGVSEDLNRHNGIIGSLFPDIVLERVKNEALNFKVINVSSGVPTNFANGGNGPTGDMVFSNACIADYDAPTDISCQGKEGPIFNSYPHTTIAFMDIAGFTRWSCERDPEQVFQLLESVYQKFDEIAKSLNVFKIETIGDCYVCATGIPVPQHDHCLIMCRFAYESMVSFLRLANALELSLGPSTGDLALRVGIHSGPVIAGVLRANKARFQLFGDAMNTASRMESTGSPGMIQMSKSSAALLIAAGKDHWIVERKDPVPVKGKGVMSTFYLKVSSDGTKLTRSDIGNDIWGREMSSSSKSSIVETNTDQTERLINWTTELMLDLLRKVVAKRNAIKRLRIEQKEDTQRSKNLSSLLEYRKFSSRRSLIDKVQQSIPLALFEEDIEEEDARQIALDPLVEEQLRSYVTECAFLYNNVAFHNFEHATHVVMSANKLLARILSSDMGGFQRMERNSIGGIKKSREQHDKTYGISSDPLMHFATIHAALVHDVAHPGVTNKQLAKNDKDMAKNYGGKSLADQRSLDLSMRLFAGEDYKDLREAILDNDEVETRRYYELLTSSVLATDIADKELHGIRQKRWDEAFKFDRDSGRALQRLSLDSFYLQELQRIEWHFKLQSGLMILVWLVMIAFLYMATPQSDHEKLEGFEQYAAGTVFAVLAVSNAIRLGPMLVRILQPGAQPLSGVEVGVCTIQFICMATNGLMASGMKTPVGVDPIFGTRVHLLRWAEWVPLVFLIYFITDGVDVPDREVGLKSKYFFAGCQAVSTLTGLLFQYAPNGVIWSMLCIFSVGLFLFMFLHLAYKRKIFNRLDRGVSAADKEFYDRAQHSLRFLEFVAFVWSVLVGFFFLERFGPMISSLLQFTQLKGFSILWQSVIDCISKMHHTNHLTKIHNSVFDTKAREERQKVEAKRLQTLANKKATILNQCIIQASDVAHCMQHWGVYQKFNRRLFEEQFRAFITGNSDVDPRPGWYKGELWFFDNYIIPLAQKLVDSGCFGVSGYEYLRSANEIRAEWKLHGKEITRNMIADFEKELPGGPKFGETMSTLSDDLTTALTVSTDESVTEMFSQLSFGHESPLNSVEYESLPGEVTGTSNN